jgi:hypothetical protein
MPGAPPALPRPAPRRPRPRLLLEDGGVVLLSSLAQGPEAAALYDAPDRGGAPPQPPPLGTAEAVAAAAADPRGQLHAGLPAALAGPEQGDVAAAHPRAAELRAGPAGLERAAAFDAAARLAVAQVLCALRPFSWG